jgi:aminomethyltransferase
MRHGHEVRQEGLPIGVVTSGTFSPTLGLSIGMAFVPPLYSEAGTQLDVDVRGRTLPVEVVPRPFYKRPRK